MTLSTVSPTLSFIVPVYNVEPYVERCLRSLLGQSCRDIEVVVVDDGSTDASLEACRAIAGQDPRVRILSKPNEGQGVARNVGLGLAAGEFVAFVDSDDWVDTDLAEHAVARLRESGGDFVSFGLDFVDSAGVVRKKVDRFPCDRLDGRAIFLDALVDRSVLSVSWNKVYRREFLLRAGIAFPPLRANEDLYFSRAVARAARTAVFLHRVYYHAYIRENSTSRRMTTRIFDATVALIAYSRERFAADLSDSVVKLHFDAHIVKLFGYLLLQAAFRVERYAEYRECFRIAESAGYGELRRRAEVLAVLGARARYVARLCSFPVLLRAAAAVAKPLGLGARIY